MYAFILVCCVRFWLNSHFNSFEQTRTFKECVLPEHPYFPISGLHKLFPIPDVWELFCDVRFRSIFCEVHNHFAWRTNIVPIRAFKSSSFRMWLLRMVKSYNSQLDWGGRAVCDYLDDYDRYVEVECWTSSRNSLWFVRYAFYKQPHTKPYFISHYSILVLVIELSTGIETEQCCASKICLTARFTFQLTCRHTFTFIAATVW